jgi:hypothetical protein
MAKQYRIHIKGKQREAIDADLMARLVVMLGRELAEDARQAAEVAREVEAVDCSAPGGADTDDGSRGATA